MSVEVTLTGFFWDCDVKHEMKKLVRNLFFAQEFASIHEIRINKESFRNVVIEDRRIYSENKTPFKLGEVQQLVDKHFSEDISISIECMVFRLMVDDFDTYLKNKSEEEIYKFKLHFWLVFTGGRYKFRRIGQEVDPELPMVTITFANEKYYDDRYLGDIAYANWRSLLHGLTKIITPVIPSLTLTQRSGGDPTNPNNWYIRYHRQASDFIKDIDESVTQKISEDDFIRLVADIPETGVIRTEWGFLVYSELGTGGKLRVFYDRLADFFRTS